MKIMRHGQARALAFTLWNGPYLLNIGEEDRFISGYQLLWLGVSHSGPTRFESRALYMHPREPGKEQQSIAVLRATYWESRAPFATIVAHNDDGTVTIQPMRPRTIEGPMFVAARFVEIPIAQAQAWMARFDRLPLTFHTSSDADERLAEERSLKIEWYQQMQLQWNSLHPDYAQLNERFVTMWAAMGDALKANPRITTVNESFPNETDPDTSVYDFAAYPPLEDEGTASLT